MGCHPQVDFPLSKSLNTGIHPSSLRSFEDPTRSETKQVFSLFAGQPWRKGCKESSPWTNRFIWKCQSPGFAGTNFTADFVFSGYTPGNQHDP